MTGSARIGWAAASAAAFGGAVAVAAPVVLFFTVSRATEAWWVLPWIAAAILAPLVFELMIPPRPEWGYGVAFAGAVGIVFGIWGAVAAPFEHSGAGQAALLGLLFLAATFLGGMGGASAASLIGRPFAPDSAGTMPGARRLSPWHVGVALLGAEIAAVAALAAARP